MNIIGILLLAVLVVHLVVMAVMFKIGMGRAYPPDRPFPRFEDK